MSEHERRRTMLRSIGRGWLQHARGPMSTKANYMVVTSAEDVVVIRDVGPWDRYKSVTNAAEDVVAELLPSLKGRRLEYFDSEGNRSELVIIDGKFAGFAPVVL